MVQNWKIGEHAEMGKGTCEYDGSKEPQYKITKEGAKNFFEKKFFDPKFSKNLYFWQF